MLSTFLINLSKICEIVHNVIQYELSGLNDYNTQPRSVIVAYSLQVFSILLASLIQDIELM